MAVTYYKEAFLRRETKDAHWLNHLNIHFETIKQLIKNDPKKSVCQVFTDSITNEAANLLAAFLADNQSIQFFSLLIYRLTQIQEPGINAFINALKSHTTLRSMTINGKTVHKAEVFLSKNREIETIFQQRTAPIQRFIDRHPGTADVDLLLLQILIKQWNETCTSLIPSLEAIIIESGRTGLHKAHKENLQNRVETITARLYALFFNTLKDRLAPLFAQYKDDLQRLNQELDKIWIDFFGPSYPNWLEKQKDKLTTFHLLRSIANKVTSFKLSDEIEPSSLLPENLGNYCHRLLERYKTWLSKMQNQSTNNSEDIIIVLQNTIPLFIQAINSGGDNASTVIRQILNFIPQMPSHITPFHDAIESSDNSDSLFSQLLNATKQLSFQEVLTLLNLQDHENTTILQKAINCKAQEVKTSLLQIINDHFFPLFAHLLKKEPFSTSWQVFKQWVVGKLNELYLFISLSSAQNKKPRHTHPSRSPIEHSAI